MCELKDFEHLRLDRYHSTILEDELEFWHRAYLPCGDVVLDVGAGNGETAQFYLNHGAKHVVCVEPDIALLLENFGRDSRITIVECAVDTIKADCEGGEVNIVVETHFPFEVGELRKMELKGSTFKIVPVRGLLFVMRVGLFTFKV